MAQAESTLVYLLAADAVLVLHLLFVAFVVVGLALILAGKAFRWAWVRNPWFRIAHLLAIGVVVVQSWFGAICPLTTIEMSLRSRAGETVYPGSFVAHWLESILYYRAPAWVFAVCYTLFGAAVIGSWFWVRPHPFRRTRNQ
ncbi:MAG: DUF2784 domain-containing protein [Rhodospirillaceae bacterium]|nr:DUF2784 domain-containing protein [Rhodospirillaceae bacterium]